VLNDLRWMLARTLELSVPNPAGKAGLSTTRRAQWGIVIALMCAIVGSNTQDGAARRIVGGLVGWVLGAAVFFVIVMVTESIAQRKGRTR
jgi:uncharacterized membrane protein YccC